MFVRCRREVGVREIGEVRERIKRSEREYNLKVKERIQRSERVYRGQRQRTEVREVRERGQRSPPAE